MVFENRKEKIEKEYKKLIKDYKIAITSKVLYMTVRKFDSFYDENLERLEKEYGYKLEAFSTNNISYYYIFRRKD